MAQQKKDSTDRHQYIETVESGAFVRKVRRVNGKKQQRTVKIYPNMKKVVLGMLGDFEIYVYPYDYPDKVFLGKFPISTMIESTNVNQFLGAYNRSRWFLKGEAFKTALDAKGANSRRRSIISAYNEGLNQIRGNEKPS